MDSFLLFSPPTLGEDSDREQEEEKEEARNQWPPTDNLLFSPSLFLFQGRALDTIVLIRPFRPVSLPGGFGRFSVSLSLSLRSHGPPSSLSYVVR